MADIRIEQGEWVVVCDGAKALVLENIGDAVHPNLKTREVYEQQNPATHAQGTDVPGRSHNSVGNARSAMDQTDWHDRAEQNFLDSLVERLNAGETRSLILAAPPRALGMIRPGLSNALRGAVRAEIDKDLVKMPVHEIEKHITG